MAEVADGASGSSGKTGSGAPGDESSTDSKNGNADDGGKSVPESRFKAALADQRRRHEAEIGGLRAEFEAFKAGSSKAQEPPKKEEQKRFARSELNAAVKAGQISQDQADDIFANQVKDEAKESATRAALEAVSRGTQQGQVDSDLAQYKRLEPELKDKSSDVFDRVREEFQYLVGRGSPNSLSTELAAIRAVLGPLEKLEKAKSASRAAEHHQESGAGGEGGAPAKKVLESMSAREKSYYQKQIDNGHYKDWASVEKLLKDHARPDVRRRAGAKV